MNYFLTHTPSLIFVDMILFALSLYALYQLRQKENYHLAAWIGSAMLFGVFTMLIHLYQGKDFSLVWTYFFVPFAVITLGAYRGFILSLIYLLVIFVESYLGIGVWLEGSWNMISFVRFSLAHVAMLYVMYTIVVSNEKANEKIEILRAQERAQMKLLEELSITDPLTSLYNRRFLEKVFPKELERAKASGANLTYILLDIDHFKPFNDTYGHHQGDLALKKIASLLKSTFPYSFRIGGDEFAALTLVTDEDDTLDQQLETLRRSVSALKLKKEDGTSTASLSCSIGVHIVNESDISLETVYQLTDQALYSAKTQGRNTIVYL